MNRIINIYDDGRWSAMLAEQARKMGWKPHLFTLAYDLVDDAPVFWRIPQNKGIEQAKSEYHKVLRSGPRRVMVPDPHVVDVYEDKIYQAKLYGPWMPSTAVLFRASEARGYAKIQEMGPLISKAAHGAASHNVRLLRNEPERMKEVREAFGRGIPIKGGVGLQIGYVLWQKFCEGNEYDYRIIINGHHRMILRRFNRDDRPMASGSGKNEPVRVLNDETRAALAVADEFFRCWGTKWCGVDLVFDRDEQRWVILESTLAWSLDAYADCRYFDAGNAPSQYRGCDQWRLLLDNLDAGVFDE